MGIRIVNEDGNGYTTRVFDSVTGEDLTNKLMMYDVTLRLGVNASVTAEIKAYAQKVDITMEQAEVKRVCPYCGHETEETIRSGDDVE